MFEFDEYEASDVSRQRAFYG